MRPGLRAKLEAMAAAEESPHEAAIARAKLLELEGRGGSVPPRRPAAAPAGPVPDPHSWSSWSSSTSTASSAWIRVEVRSS